MCKWSILYWVRTDFWIQNSRLFSRTIISFSRLKVSNRWSKRGFEHHYGRRFINLEYQYGKRYVIWKRSILWKTSLVFTTLSSRHWRFPRVSARFHSTKKAVCSGVRFQKPTALSRGHNPSRYHRSAPLVLRKRNKFKVWQ